ncbi:MAG: von Willebrand factor type A domain-containing protein [Clostridia bacterium]|nr:von Willebrand factor type A domain-containing protein [Clostridia bacterium]
MKRTKLMMKLSALALAALCAVSLASCNTPEAPAEQGGFLENMGGIAGSYPNSLLNGSPKYEFDDEVQGEAGTTAGTTVPSDPDSSEEESAGENIPVDPQPADLLLNQFINASEQPFSTFSADVDTASYTYFRKLVNAGYGFRDLRNSGSNFRIEEFINYFRYDVDEPREGELFGVKTELVACPWNEESLLFRVTLKAEDAKPSAGNNLVFLIDVSGSMSSRDKLPLLKKAFSYLVSNLGSNDTVSIVTYSGREAVVLEGCNGLQSDRIMNAINNLSASGSTNGEAGLTMAYRIAESYFIDGGNNRIIMASDGDLNVGISSSSELKNYIEQKRDQGVYLSVLGFGTGNYRDANMEALADNGNGVYYYIDGESEAEKIFGTDLAGTMYTVANDVKLQIEFNKERVDSYRLVGYDNRILDKEDFENDAKDAGDVGAAHQVTVVYEIKLADLEGEDFVDAPLMTLRVRYKDPGQTISKLNEYWISGVTNEPSEDMRFITAVIEMAALLRNAGYEDDITLDSICADLSALELEDSYKREFRDLIKALGDKE